MITKLTALVGFGAGYVLGAKAGTQRYQQIMTKLDELRGTPQVRQATDAVGNAATDLADKARDLANETVERVTTTSVDLTDSQAQSTAAASNARF